MKKIFSSWKQDFPAGLVVFLVALPLCLGVALGSTGTMAVPNLFSGIIAGVIGGIIVGIFSGSRLGVSGPAAGLITIVASAIVTLGSYEAFLLAVIIAGALQLLAGYFKLGIIGNYFPSSVIKGMLAAIGLTLIFKQVPHLVGYDKDFMGDEQFAQVDGQNTFSELLNSLNYISPTAVLIAVISLAILILFDRPFMKKIALFKILPGALFVVVLGIVINLLAPGNMKLSGEHLVSIPVANSFQEFRGFFTQPNFSAFTDYNVYIIAFTIALVASLETLLSVEATDKLDPEKFVTPTNKELKAQGLGNIISGLLGGLPVTQVIVRSSANINSGGQSKLSTIFHGVLLLLSVIIIPQVLNLIPYASLAAILVMVGYKLSNVGLYKQMYKLGIAQFLPFLTTIVVVMFTDLLKGMFAGLFVAVFFIIKNSSGYFKNKKNLKSSIRISKDRLEADKEVVTLTLAENVTFLNKGQVKQVLNTISENQDVVIDGTQNTYVDYDVLEVIQEFKESAPSNNISVKTIAVEEVNVMGH